MAKTAKSKTFRFAKVEIVISATNVSDTALTTAETIDLSSIFAGPLDQPQISSRDIEETPVSGDPTPILSAGPAGARKFAFTFLYTEGETLGTDNLDPYQELFKVCHEASVAQSLQMIFSPAGGAVGDNEYTTHASESFIESLSDPVGGVDSSKIMFTVVIATPDLTVGTVT